MITADELRLGNKVIINIETDLISTVTSINENSVEVSFDEKIDDCFVGVSVNPKELFPIKIKSKLLKKIGVKKIDNSIEILLDKSGESMIMFKYLFGNWEAGYFYNSNYVLFFDKITYVHELQNLYFLLTKRELEIPKNSL